MNLKFWNKKPEPPKPTFRESLAMLAALVATVTATAVAAYKAVVLAFEIIYALPAYIRATIGCAGFGLQKVWSFVTYIPVQAYTKLRNLLPARGTTTTAETTTTVTEEQTA